MTRPATYWRAWSIFGGPSTVFTSRAQCAEACKLYNRMQWARGTTLKPARCDEYGNILLTPPRRK